MVQLQLSHFLLFLPFVLTFAAANDWSTPCLNGVCQYSITTETSSGSVKLWGSTDAISDITNAAGWEILGCSNESSQDIRLVCVDEDTESPECDHLHDDDGAEGKLVRLPGSCGGAPFALVKKSWIPEDQTVPSNLAKRIAKRDGTLPTVHALSLDTNFTGGAFKRGPINFAIQASTSPRQDLNRRLSLNPTGPQRRSRLNRDRRGLAAFINATVQVAENSDDIHLNDTIGKQSIPDIEQSFNLFNDTLSCPPVEGKVSVDVTAKATGLQTSLNIIVFGTLGDGVLPNITYFHVSGDLDANFTGTLDLTTNVQASLNKEIPLLPDGGIPIPFLSLPLIPGVIDLGATFQIDAKAVANLDLSTDVSIGLVYQIKDAHFSFPPESGNSSTGSGNSTTTGSGNCTTTTGSWSVNSTDPYQCSDMDGNQNQNGTVMQVPPSNATESAFRIADTPLTLSIDPSAQAKGTLEGHIIPKLNFGFSSLFGSEASANVFIALDTSAVASLTVDASGGSVSVPIPVGSNSTNGTDQVDVSGPSFNGNVDVSAGLVVSVGAEAGFLKFLGDLPTLELFNKQFQIFQKSFGDGANSADSTSNLEKRLVGVSRRRVAYQEKRADSAKCFASAPGQLASVFAGTVASSSVTPK